MLGEASPSLVGATGRFTILRRLGTGGFADVYEALDRKSQQRVALKLVRSRSRNSPDRRQLEREYQALKQVQHRNLARCHDLFLEDQDAYFTLELAEGTGLIDYVRADTRRQLPSSDFVACTGLGLERLRAALPQLVAGVEALHGAQLVHGDLHPGNVRVTFGGRVVVIDYGLATTHQGESVAPNGTPIVGTPNYMAPEQHDPLLRSPASDWYSLGVLLFEALTGALPFAGNDHEVFVRKRTLAAPRASSLVNTAPPDLDDLCSELLKREPGARPTGPTIRALLGS